LRGELAFNCRRFVEAQEQLVAVADDAVGGAPDQN